MVVADSQSNSRLGPMKVACLSTYLEMATSQQPRRNGLVSCSLARMSLLRVDQCRIHYRRASTTDFRNNGNSRSLTSLDMIQLAEH
jgi:hypothetical protein